MPTYSGVWNLVSVYQAQAQGNWPVPPPSVIGQAYGGGYYAGQISTTGDGVATHYLIVAPKASGQSGGALDWKDAQTSTTGTNSVIDGPTNSANMNNVNHPAAQFCEGLSIGGYSDWYLPAKNELEVCYYNLKPTTTSNNTSSGANTNAVPSRGSNYTSGTPGQTSATDFQTGNTEAFNATNYWTSTQASSTNAWIGSFDTGEQATSTKTSGFRVRAVRRIPV